MAEDFKTVAKFSDAMSAHITAGMLNENGTNNKTMKKSIFIMYFGSYVPAAERLPREHL